MDLHILRYYSLYPFEFSLSPNLVYLSIPSDRNPFLIAKLLLYIYHNDTYHRLSFDLKICLSKHVHHASKEHHNEIHVHNFYNKIYYSSALAGPHPNNRTDQYAEYFLNLHTEGSAEFIPNRKTLSDSALALFHVSLSIPSEW